MISRRTVLGSSLLTGIADALPASEDKSSVPMRIFDELAEKIKAPGIFMTIVKEGKVLTHYCYGKASLPFDVPVMPNTLFHIGSMGKHVTAIGILRLMAAGELKLDAPIGDYLKDIPASCADRSLRSLLNQTSGIRDYSDAIVSDDFSISRADIIKALAEKAPTFEAESAWAYSNSNYLLLGWIIEKVTGLSYADFIRKQLFEPAKTPSARADAAEDVIRHRAEPYSWKENHYIHAPRLESEASAFADGGVLFSSHDIQPWLHALTSNKLISEKEGREALRSAKLKTARCVPYGFGWFLGKTSERFFHHHAGNMPGFTAFCQVIPEPKLAVCICANGQGVNLPLIHLARVALESVLPGCTTINLEPIASDPVDASFREMLAAGKDINAKANFLAPEMEAVLSSELTRTRAIPIVKAPFTVTPLEEYAVAGGRMRRYQIKELERSRINLVGFTDDGRIFWRSTE
jgi:D-alanyl-D-alanine carboxypeptidase